MKKLLSICLAVLVVVGLMPVYALADGDQTVTVNSPSNGTLTVTYDGGQTITGTGMVPDQTKLTITATPTGDYELEKITVNSSAGNQTFTSSPADYTVNGAAVEISATFKEKAQTLTLHTVNITPPTNGTVSVSVDGSPINNGASVEEGKILSITTTPSTGYELDELTVSGAVKEGDTYKMGTGDVTVSATFKLIPAATHTVNITPPTNGTVSVSVDGSPINNGASVEEGKILSITTTPSTGYELDELTVSGAVKEGDTYKMGTGDVTISATFKLIPVGTRTVKWSTDNYGSIKVSVDGTTIKNGDAVAEGKSLKIEVTPDTNYELKEFTINGAKQTGPSPFTYTVGSDNLALKATFQYDGGASNDAYVYRPLGVYDDEGDPLEDNTGSTFGRGVISEGKVVLDGVLPNQTFYIKLGEAGSDYITTLSGGGKAHASDLVDDDLFKISVDKDGDGKSLISRIEQVEEKRLGGMSRASYLKVTLKDTTTTDELKANAEIKFKAKKDKDGSWKDGEYAILNLNMWISNTKVSGSDGDADTGDKIYFSPEANENNVLIWGDDRAALEFTADDDAKDFYARLSTRSMSDIYAEYGDPVDADLWFYDFIGNPSIPSTSRAYLTLGIPWDDDDDHTPDPRDVYIYRLDKDGYLEDVTAMFTYSEDDREIEGWTTRTRTLGTYIVSDTELDIDSYYDDDDTESPTIDVSNNQKPVPNTGR